MDITSYKPRLIDKKVETYLRIFGAVCIEGPKRCGKTWTASFHSKSKIFIADPKNNFSNRKLAEVSPDLVLPGENPRLLDEWQEVPSIWDAVRYFVDDKGQKGMFILTGSATPPHKGILHSGAGRFGKLRMRPMSLYESGNSTGQISLKDLCDGKISPVLVKEVKIQDLIGFILRGGWPGSINFPIEEASILSHNYIKLIVDDDVHRIDGIKRNSTKINLLLHSLARNECTTASDRTLKNDIKAIDDEDIDIKTVKEYLDIFDRLFLIDNQLPFSPGMRSSVRVKQSVKRHFVDPSLAAALLNATPESLLGDLETLGFLFESLCERDLKIYAETFDSELYHYQDYKGREIDAVIALPDGSWCAFEIKLGANQIDKAAENLLQIKNEFKEDPKATPPKVLCVICGLTNAAYKRPDGVFVVPITALKN